MKPINKVRLLVGFEVIALLIFIFGAIYNLPLPEYNWLAFTGWVCVVLGFVSPFCFKP